MIVQYLRVSEKPKEEWAVERDGKLKYSEFLRLSPKELMRVRFVRFEDE